MQFKLYDTVGAACGNDAVGAVYRRAGQYCDKGFIRKVPGRIGSCTCRCKGNGAGYPLIGFYHSKAKNLIETARRICVDFGGEVPSSLEELTSLPGSAERRRMSSAAIFFMNRVS